MLLIYILFYIYATQLSHTIFLGGGGMGDLALHLAHLPF